MVAIIFKNDPIQNFNLSFKMEVILEYINTYLSVPFDENKLSSLLTDDFSCVLVKIIGETSITKIIKRDDFLSHFKTTLTQLIKSEIISKDIYELTNCKFFVELASSQTYNNEGVLTQYQVEDNQIYEIATDKISSIIHIYYPKIIS